MKKFFALLALLLLPLAALAASNTRTRWTDVPELLRPGKSERLVFDCPVETEATITVLDASGPLLREGLRAAPVLIKPNLDELRETFGVEAATHREIVQVSRSLLEKTGVRVLCVSMGGDGAVMVTEAYQALYVRAARGQLVNSVGAGDSMIAGFIHEYLASGNYFSALNFATAAGSACAFTQHLATKEQIEYIESLML